MTRRIVLAALVGSVWMGCARVVPPAGGPEDLEPPRLVGSVPDSGAVGVSRDVQIRLRFTEWVDPTTARSAISVMPAGTKAPDIRVDGPEVLVRLREPLDSPSTYVLRIQPGLSDWRRAATKAVQEIPFSTGTRIDSGRVEVRTWVGSDTTAPVPVKARLGAWPLDSAARKGLARLLRRKDSTQWLAQAPMPFRERPWRWTWADTAFVADLRFLPEGAWRVMAWDDKDKDNFWRPGQEPIAFLGDVRGKGNRWMESFVAKLVPEDTGEAAPRDTTLDSLRRRDSVSLDSLAGYWDRLPEDSTGTAFVALDSLPKAWKGKSVRMRLWPVFRRARPRLSSVDRPELRLAPGRWSGEVWLDRDLDGRPLASSWRSGRTAEPWCHVPSFNLERQDSVRVRVQCLVHDAMPDTGKVSP
ncbi:MAG TPA: Ig-like domain-containing protein [Fibrobacteria bacterium]|nr:Ig-like domain-containing protein [Fibrobacteria bacterium]HOX49845.1 Ig-like domain-containing protein [Fibrobacteria bacterium]